MDEKKTQIESEKKEETTPKTETTPTEDVGAEKTTSVLDRADEINDRKERILKREEALQDRKDAFAARKAVGGITEAGQPTEKKEETDEEYTEKFQKGEVNPFKKDAVKEKTE